MGLAVLRVYKMYWSKERFTKWWCTEMKVKPKIPRKMEGRVSDVFSGSLQNGRTTHCKHYHFVGILDRWNSHCFVLTCLYFIFFHATTFWSSAHLPLSCFKTFSWHVSWSSVCKASCLLHHFLVVMKVTSLSTKWYVLGFWSTKWLELMSGQVYVLQLLGCFSIP